MLKYAFGHRAIFHADLLAEYAGEAALAAALAQGQRMDRGALLITGHYGVEHPLVVHAKRPVRIAAVMRHPLERIISLYDYIRGRPDHPEHAALIGCTLHQALDRVPEFAAHCRNATAQPSPVRDLDRKPGSPIGKPGIVRNQARQLETASLKPGDKPFSPRKPIVIAPHHARRLAEAN